MYPSSYPQPGMGGPGYPMMPPQPNLMMGMPQQGNEGLNNVFNAQADGMKIMNLSLKTPYVGRLDTHVGDDDDSDCDEEKNNKSELKQNCKLSKINTESNPFRYLFGASAENWHKYYDFIFSQDQIYKDFVLVNNANISEKIYPQPRQAADMEILRRVVKQGPIIAAKTWLTRSIFLFIIILIIMLILSVIGAAQISGIVFAVVGGLAVVVPLFLLYDWKYNSKGRGINRWTTVKNDIERMVDENITTEGLYKKIDEKFKYLNPFQGITVHHSNQPAQPAQQSGTGVIQGIANVVQFFNK